MKQPTVYLLSCGDELLFGHTVDTNSAWLAEQCTLLGWRIIGHRTVGDVSPDIIGAFLEAASKAQFVILTGGLGPTRDDRTRDALAHAMGVELEENPEAIEEIAAVFARYRHPMTESNRVQALIPVGAKRIVNPYGTAPGIHATLGDAQVFCMPGVPKEMRQMFDQTIRPLMEGAPGATSEYMRRLHMCGRGESDIGEQLRHLMKERSNPEVGTTVAESIITVRMYAKGDTMDEARKISEAAEKDIRAILEQDIFGVDGESLPVCVLNLLRERKAKLVTAESCTGGMLASMLVDIPGSSDVFVDGVVAYANETKMRRLGVSAEILEKHGAVSRETAAAMAENPLRTGDYSLPVYALATTGVAGPDGGTPEKPVGTVWLACSRLNPDGSGLTRSMLYHTHADRHGVRMRSANAALDLLRRTILDYPSRYPWEDRAWKKD